MLAHCGGIRRALLTPLLHILTQSVHQHLEKENTLLKKEIYTQRQKIAELTSRLASVTKLVCAILFQINFSPPNSTLYMC